MYVKPALWWIIACFPKFGYPSICLKSINLSTDLDNVMIPGIFATLMKSESQG